MSERLNSTAQTTMAPAKEYESILRSFVSQEYANVIGMYLWSVVGKIIDASPEFESLCADLKDIKATPYELSIKLNELRTGPKAPFLPQRPASNHRYLG